MGSRTIRIYYPYLATESPSRNKVRSPLVALLGTTYRSKRGLSARGANKICTINLSKLNRNIKHHRLDCMKTEYNFSRIQSQGTIPKQKHLGGGFSKSS